MAGTLKGKLLASFMRLWDAASSVLNALAIFNCLASVTGPTLREEMHLSEKSLPLAILLPDELVVEILSWLPVKALMRFRCVSKSWNSLVFHPTFVKLHLQRLSSNTHLLLPFIRADWNPRYGRIAPCSIRGLLENPSSTIDDCCHRFNYNYYVCGSSDGLVCLHNSFAGHEFEEHWVQFWNPATRIMSQDSPRLRLPSTNFSRIGFGFDDLSNTYKVVMVTCDIGSEYWKVRVHCLGDTCWRDVLTCPALPTLGPPNGQFVGGTVNWLALRSLTFTYPWKTVTFDQLVIFSYDMRSETYRYLLMPDGLLENPKYEPCLRVLKGCLCLSYDFGETYFSVWIMREFGVEKSWTRLLKVSYDNLENCSVLPLWMSENEDVMLLESVGGYRFLLYSRRDNRVDWIKSLYHKLVLRSYDYVHSLVLPY